ncbi:MAG: hypothetical protein D4R97_05615 [Bacteroidetes bacterium]|nr:MAG: hypothetical protein D4R97_05615 [Bacteroidota bacterium]
MLDAGYWMLDAGFIFHSSLFIFHFYPAIPEETPESNNAVARMKKKSLIIKINHYFCTLN